MHTHTRGEPCRAYRPDRYATGWVWRHCDFGGLIFVDPVTARGLTQILFDLDVDEHLQLQRPFCPEGSF